MSTLTPAQRKALRAEAHGLKPVVLIGADGLTDNIKNEVHNALQAHELIKVRVFGDDRTERETIYQTLCDELQAQPVQHIGKLLVLWRERLPEDDALDDADAIRGKGPKTVKLIKTSKRGGQRPEVRHVKVLGNQHMTASGRMRRKKARTTSIKKKAQ